MNRHPKSTWVLRGLLVFIVLLFVIELLPGGSSPGYGPLMRRHKGAVGNQAGDEYLQRRTFPGGAKQAPLLGPIDHLLESGIAFPRFQKEREAHQDLEAIYPSTLPEQEFIQYARVVEGLRDLNDFLTSSELSDLSSADVVAHSLRYTRSLELAAEKLAGQSTQRARSIITRLRDSLRDAIYKNQNPSDCSDVEAIGCKVGGSKGFAAAFGEMTHCLASGLMLNKTVVFYFSKWAYAGETLWNELFEPISSCEAHQLRRSVDWSYPKGWWLERKDMTRLPDLIAGDLISFHGDPLGWFHGQLASYILRPSRKFQIELDRRVRAVDENRDYVGLHIRRTDKGSEALLRDTKFYMRYVEEYFRRETLRREIQSKKVYVATDDPAAVEELRLSYPNFEFSSNSEAIEQANDVNFRTSDGALRNVMIDFFVLSRSQFFACALSSGFARVAYSLMHYEYFDAWKRIGSLDVPFYYAYAFLPERLPVEPVEDLVLPNEVGFSQTLGELDEGMAYSLAVEYYFGWAKTKLLPDGTVPTYIGSKVQAKFKTEQPFRTDISRRTPTYESSPREIIALVPCHTASLVPKVNSSRSAVQKHQADLSVPQKTVCSGFFRRYFQCRPTTELARICYQRKRKNRGISCRSTAIMPD